MFGRKFLLLKKKIYELEEDCNNLSFDDGLFFKENKIDEDSFSLNKQLSNSQTLQTFSFGDKNPFYNGNIISSDINQSHQFMSQGIQSQNFTFSNPNVMTTSKIQPVQLKNIKELENVFGSCFENKLSYVYTENNPLSQYTDIWNIEMFPNLNFKDQRFTKFKFCLENVNNRIESVFKKKIIHSQDDVEKFLNSKKIEYNKNIKIFYNDRFFIYPSTILLKKYYKIKFNNITNKIISVSNDDIQLDASLFGKEENRYKNLEVQNIFSFSFILNEKFDENSIKIKEFQVKNAELSSLIENCERLLEKANKESFAMEEKKAVIFYLRL